MGDPRKTRSKYSGPQHPWNRKRLEEERLLVSEYGLKNKKDLWKVTSKLTHYKKQAKTLIARRGKQAETEKQLFLQKLQKLKLIGESATVDDVLQLTAKDLLERRLQTMVMRKGFAQSAKQSRQFIVHGHIAVHGQIMTVPSFLVPGAVEDMLSYASRSALSEPEHPVRQVKEKAVAPKAEEKTEEVAAA